MTQGQNIKETNDTEDILNVEGRECNVKNVTRSEKKPSILIRKIMRLKKENQRLKQMPY